MYIHVYSCVLTSTHVCAHVFYTWNSMHAHTHTHIYICIYIYVYIYTHTYSYGKSKLTVDMCKHTCMHLHAQNG